MVRKSVILQQEMLFLIRNGREVLRKGLRTLRDGFKKQNVW
jgi:hypothetical protein